MTKLGNSYEVGKDNENTFVVVQFGKSWCPPCKHLQTSWIINS